MFSTLIFHHTQTPQTDHHPHHNLPFTQCQTQDAVKDLQDPEHPSVLLQLGHRQWAAQRFIPDEESGECIYFLSHTETPRRLQQLSASLDSDTTSDAHSEHDRFATSRATYSLFASHLALGLSCSLPPPSLPGFFSSSDQFL